MTEFTQRDDAFLVAVRRIAEEVAGPNAIDVDQAARFPRESVDALREAGLLAAFVPQELGGGGMSFPALAHACFELGRSCGASAMVFAMHQIQVVTMVPTSTTPRSSRSTSNGLPARACSLRR